MIANSATLLFEEITKNYIKLALCKYISIFSHNIVYNLIEMHAQLLQVKLQLKTETKTIYALLRKLSNSKYFQIANIKITNAVKI